MAEVNVLIAVDVEGAQSSGKLQDNVYLVDTNKFLGSYTEGGAELVTVLGQGDTVVWSVDPINPGNNVSIASFTGQAITGGNVVPTQNGDGSWSSKYTETPYKSGDKLQYSVNLSFEGTTMGFDPFLVSK